jgi:thioredoxin-related protein
MNKIIVGLSIIATCAFAEIHWAQSYDAALEKAAKEKKIVMVMLSKEECPACEYMNDVVFEEQVVEDTINKNFVPVHLDIHKDKIPDQLGYIGTPTFHFLNSKGAKLSRYDGAANIPTFLSVLNNVKK